ncbi:MAG: DUF892 family protein [Hyphomicrobiales bacterium]|nr:DUF892 family protein [Hyphomicrobiales bacterium]
MLPAPEAPTGAPLVPPAPSAGSATPPSPTPALLPHPRSRPPRCGDEVLKNTFANEAFEHYEIAAYKSLLTLCDKAGVRMAAEPLRSACEVIPTGPEGSAIELPGHAYPRRSVARANRSERRRSTGLGKRNSRRQRTSFYPKRQPRTHRNSWSLHTAMQQFGRDNGERNYHAREAKKCSCPARQREYVEPDPVAHSYER